MKTPQLHEVITKGMSPTGPGWLFWLTAGRLPFQTKIVIAISFLSLTSAWSAPQQPPTSDRHVVTVADSIRMSVFADPEYSFGRSFKHRVAQFSPNGKQFVILLKRGIVENNTIEYSLLRFRTERVVQGIVSPENLVSFASSSNRPAIQQVTWVDNRTLAFLAENPEQLQQLYLLDCETRKLTRLTNHQTSLTSYALAKTSSRIVFTAEKLAEPLWDSKGQRHGIVVGTQLLSDLISLQIFNNSLFRDLFTQVRGKPQEHRINTIGITDDPALWPSPDGHNLIIQTYVTTEPPSSWKEYKDPILRQELDAPRAEGKPILVYQFELVNPEIGSSQRLLNAPSGVGGSSEVAWANDGRSVVISGTYLPIDANGPDRDIRSRKRFVAEIKPPEKEIVPITAQELHLRRWDPQHNHLIFQTSVEHSPNDPEGRVVGYRRTETGWDEIPATTVDLSDSDKVEVTLEEDMNTPPKIFVEKLESQEKTLLYDLNPQFRSLQFGRVEEVIFNASDGHPVKAGIYFPPRL